MNESADFVMYWWDRAAELLTRKNTALRRFGFVTTNSISQVFQRRVTERHFNARKPVSLIFAIPDHPWTKATKDAAAVRIAMTAAVAGKKEGRLCDVTQESGLDTDDPQIEFLERTGTINSDLTVGVDLSKAKALTSNEGLSSRGVSLHGAGFIVTPAKAKELGLGRIAGLERHIRPYRNGRDLTARPRDVMVIDLFGLSDLETRQTYPAVYQHVMAHVKPERDANNRATYRDNWWLFGEPRKDLRPALAHLPRYIATVETAKHRVFQFLDAAILPDNKLLAIASDSAFTLGVLQSRTHWHWYVANSGKLGVYKEDAVYVKTRCFDPFPFPLATPQQKARIAALAEELDAHRKRVLAQHAHLTLTGLYNVLERVRAGAALTPEERRVFDDGLVLILRELHDDLDRAVSDAYGWPATLADEDVLARLVALNAERAKEEARGLVRWLRPDYQIPRFGTAQDKAQLELDGAVAAQEARETKIVFPADSLAQTAAIMATLSQSGIPVDASALARRFTQGRKVEPRISELLSAITRMGFATTTPDGRFALNKGG